MEFTSEAKHWTRFLFLFRCVHQIVFSHENKGTAVKYFAPTAGDSQDVEGKSEK